MPEPCRVVLLELAMVCDADDPTRASPLLLATVAAR